MYNDRVELYKKIEQARNSRILVYVTGDRPNLDAQIAPEVLDHFLYHLDLIGVTDKISLYLYTRGGSTLAAWSIVNLVRQFCNDFEVIVPSKALSSGTLICLGANRIIMTKQATLGPIDPSVNGPLNPSIPGAAPGARAPVSVEAINGFVSFAKDNLGIKDEAHLTSILLALAGHVHPLVLGNVYRTRAQIRMLGERLLSQQVTDPEKVNAILSFLISESGSHDYTIYRREARNTLGLNIEKPDDQLYRLVKDTYDNIAAELSLTDPFDPGVFLAQAPNKAYSFPRALVESTSGGSHSFLSEGQLLRQQVQTPTGIQFGIEDRRNFEGWRHRNA